MHIIRRTRLPHDISSTSFSAELVTVIQTSRGKVCVAKLGSGEATARYVQDRRSLFAFCAKLRLRYKQKAKHLLKSKVMSPDAIGFLVAKQHKKCPIDFSVLALGKIKSIFY